MRTSRYRCGTDAVPVRYRPFEYIILNCLARDDRAMSAQDEFLAGLTADQQLQYYKLQNARLLEQQVALQQKVALQASSPPVTSEGGNVLIEFDASPDGKNSIDHTLLQAEKSKSSGGTVSETLPSTRVGQRTMKAAARMKVYYKGDYKRIGDSASIEVDKVSSQPTHMHDSPHSTSYSNHDDDREKEP